MLSWQWTLYPFMIPSLWECFGVWFHERLSKLLSLLIIPCELINWNRLEEGFKHTHLIPDSGQAAFYHSLMFSAIIRCGEMFTPFSKHGNYKPVFPHIVMRCYLSVVVFWFSSQASTTDMYCLYTISLCFSVSFCPCLLLFSEERKFWLNIQKNMHLS